jgi:hypothetical protein
MEKIHIKNPVTIEAGFIVETEHALRLDCEGTWLWFPKSMVHFDHDKKELTLSKWLFREKFPNEPV